MPALTDPLPDVTSGSYDLNPVPAATPTSQPAQPGQPGTQQQQPPPQPSIATPDPANPDAPQKALIDPVTGDPTTFYGSQIALVQQFDQYIKSGGDITKLGANDFATVQKAVDNVPDFKNQTDSPAVMYSRLMEGLEKNIAIEAAKKGWGSAIGEQMPAVPGAIWNFGKDLFNNAKDFVWQHTIGETGARLQDVGDMLHGDFSGSHLANMQAGSVSALSQQAMKNIDFYTRDLPGGASDISALYALAKTRASTSNPDQAAQLDFKQSEILRGQVLRTQQDHQDMTDMRNAIAGGYKLLGAADFAQQIVTSKPSDADMFVAGLVTDPANLVTGGIEGAGKALVAGVADKFFIKTAVRTARVEEATAAASDVASHLDSVNSARTDIISILSGDGRPLDPATRSGFEANLQRLNIVQGKLQADLGNLTAEKSAAIAEVNKQMDSQAKANPLRAAAGVLVQGIGRVGEVPGQIANVIDAIPKGIVNRVMGDAPDEVKAIAAGQVKKWMEVGTSALLGHHFGGITGALGAMAGGGLVGQAVGASAEMLQRFSRDLRTIGQQYALGEQTLPFYKAMSEKLTGVSSWLASKMDNQLVYSVPSAMTGGALGSAIGGGLGLVGGGGNPQAFQQGVASGGLIGSAGGGLGQLKRFNSPAELRQAAIGDRSRFIGSLTQPNKDLFLKLHPEYQLALGTYGMAHPDLNMQFVHDPGGSNGSYKLNPTPSVTINVASDNPLEAVASHEVAHHIAAHGLGTTVDAHIRGNPLTGQAGIMNELGPDGKPLIQYDQDGKASYVMNRQFETYKADYNARKKRDNPSEPPEDDYGIAQEMFAELHASTLTDRASMQKMVRGYIPSDMFSENATANWLIKLGMGADPITGNPIPTGALDGVNGLQRIIRDFYRQREYKKRPVEGGGHLDDIKVQVGDMVKGTPEFDQIQTNLNSSGDLHRNPDGSIAVDLSGRPRVKTSRQADADAAIMGKTINDLYQAQPGLEGVEGDNYLKLVTDRNGREVRRGQRVPEEVFNELERSNQFNANQILNWRKIDGAMQRNDGTMFNAVYNTASKGKGRYATLPARERSFVPVYSEVSPVTNQVNIAAYDPELLQASLNKRLRSKTGKDLYNGNIGPALADVRTYLGNLAADQPGETGLGLQKKGFINELFGFNADANPYAADVVKRSPDVFKSFRIDRVNRIAEIPGAAEAFHAKTYEQVRSFMQPRQEPVPVAAGTGEAAQYQPRGGKQESKLPPPDAPPDDSAIPVSYRMTKTGSIQPVQHSLDITRAPLIAGKEPPEIPTGKAGADFANNFEHVKFLSKPEQKQLTHLDDASAVTTYADKLVDDFQKHAEHPMADTIMGAKPWYTDVLGILNEGFGKHAELFSHLLAATSSGQSVVQNFKDAREAFEQWRNGAYDDDIAQFKKTGKITEEMKPLKANGQKFGRNSDAVLKVLAGTWLKTVEGPKTPNFFDNLFGKGTRATIDVWAGRTMRRLGFEGVEGAPKRWRLQPKNEAGVSNLEFAFSQEVFDQAAKKLGMDAHELQAIMWYGEKVHWADKGYSKGGTAAALESYIPQLREYAQQRQAAGAVEH
jgi:hypothetical protein